MWLLTPTTAARCGNVRKGNVYGTQFHPKRVGNRAADAAQLWQIGAFREDRFDYSAGNRY
jgi:hypothetical protein